MDPQLSAAGIALLFGAAKIGLIGTVGFAIAWFRARARIQKLESSATQQLGSGLDERIDRIEQTVDYIASQMERLAESDVEPRRHLPPSEGDT